MPAKNLLRTATKGSYSHIYNKGIEGKFIFGDKIDYEVFLGYLIGYLSPAPDSNSVKTTFNIKGKTFRGTPHQPKNYFKEVELCAYRLMPDHFHLVIHQISDNSLEGFMRSLCTRYSMYFNKKYKRNGTLFQGPYKSIEVKDHDTISLLTSYLHFKSDENSSAQYYSSSELIWLKPVINSSIKYEETEVQKDILKNIIFENFDSHFERKNARENIHVEEKTKDYVPHVVSKKKSTRIPELFASIAIFIILLGIGMQNINTSSAKSEDSLPKISFVLGDSVSPTPQITPTASPSASPDASPIASPSAKPKTMLTVKISDGSPSINIRQEPSVSSLKVGTATNGQTFEYVSTENGWYRIVLQDGMGYISPKYIKLLESNN